MNTNGNNTDFLNLPDAEKLNLIEEVIQKLSVDDKAKLIKSLLGGGLQIVAAPSQINAANVFSNNIYQVSLMDKAEMGSILEAIADKLKSSN
ncbi:hypothetical protein VB713_20420 [Anabaena cylindrica UHCC 0172]|uniref:hypothetical protein n=1 Tax=Anabaena cylindrica TaxID=1165 RepID=UPI002B20CB58|nr:hypothetical protein [Anabaena cylindrica]MEA5553307.1 hypothetical protein [Anabaena cylindrica UHCC 0172]